MMVFWGAPLDDPEHIKHACESALMVHEQVGKLNQQWKNQGKIPFPTRIGMHTGDVIIGNLGASDRLNYTAIGDNVNVASRLERLNKVYGTQIIISAAIQNRVADDFITRKLDCVVVKGRKKSGFIYELIAPSTDSNKERHRPFIQSYEAGLDAYRQQKWDEAITHFQQCLLIKTDDNSAQLMIERCQQYQSHPVPDGWDGAWVYTEK